MPPEISNTKSSATDELRMRNYRAQVERRNDAELREIDSRHQEEVGRVLGYQADQMEQLRHAYDVRLSGEMENQEQKLAELRRANEERLETEKRAADESFEKVSLSHKKRIDDYKRASETQMETLRKQLQASAETLHEQAKKNSKRDQEAVSR